MTNRDQRHLPKLAEEADGTICQDYVPDYEAQGDCINCGWGWENHPKSLTEGRAVTDTGIIGNLLEPSCFHGNGMSRESDLPRWAFGCEGNARKTHSWSKNGSGCAVCNHCGMRLTVTETWDCYGEREET